MIFFSKFQLTFPAFRVLFTKCHVEIHTAFLVLNMRLQLKLLQNYAHVIISTVEPVGHQLFDSVKTCGLFEGLILLNISIVTVFLCCPVLENCDLNT